MSEHQIPLPPGPWTHRTDMGCPCGPTAERRRRDDGTYGLVVGHGDGTEPAEDQPEE